MPIMFHQILSPFSELGFNLVLKSCLILIPLVVFLIGLKRQTPKYKNLPRGSLGFPVLGESLSFLKAQRQNRGAEWIKKKVKEHGPVFKTSLMGSPTIVVTGRESNKFLFTADHESLAMMQPPSAARIAGIHNFFGLNGERYLLAS